MTWFVNSEPVDDDAVREEARMMRPRYMEAVTDMDPIDAEMQLREWARENVFERMLLRQQAAADSEPVPEEAIVRGMEAIRNNGGGQPGCATQMNDDELRRQVETQYRIERLVQRIQSSAGAPKSKETGDYYKKNKEQFRTPELMHAAHIVKNVNEQQDEAAARAGIEIALEELRAGAAFAEVADRHSDCAGNGGDLGWFPRGEMVDEFDNVAFSLQTGAMSEIFRSVFGFHIVKVLERKPAGVRGFAEVKDEIERALSEQKREKALEDYLDRLRAAADIRQDNSKAAG
jgi:parvulin-like peptidyl-prolyl isomerase